MQNGKERIQEEKAGRPTAEIYVARLPKTVPERHFFCEEREREIRETQNPNLKAGRILDWQILLYAAEHALALREEEIRFYKDPSGKWCCEQFFFSLSHTRDTVAVGISDAAIGIDIENAAVRRRRLDSDAAFAQRLRRKICAPGEEPEDNGKNLIRLWVLKESIYKCYGGRFDPAAIETDGYRAEAFRLPGEPELLLAVCGEGLENARFFRFEEGAAFPLDAVRTKGAGG